ncbi:DUF2034 domain-containing protein [Acidithiobacillus sp. IBUN Pt1247-S3]|uniref:restriction endonuclease n=1 Tax=Acidithiobacillus sp. IBUN Pt1247-S3 TaxID=3166642 RepID=UPI0034E5264D
MTAKSERGHLWILAAAMAIIALVFAWVVLPIVFPNNGIGKALLGPMQLLVSLFAAFSVITALKLYLGNTGVVSKPSQRIVSGPGTGYTAYSPSPSERPARPAVYPEPPKRADQTQLPPNNIQTVWNLKLLQSLDWKRFEDLCSEYIKSKGVRAETTSLGADGGIDVRAYNQAGELQQIIQCKAWKQDVGVKYVRELAGSLMDARARFGVFICSSDYTADACAFARKNHIVLITGVDLVNAITALPVAEQHRLLAFATAGDYTTPTCPKCGIKMVKRRGHSDFWGCANYPKCRRTFPMSKTV